MPKQTQAKIKLLFECNEDCIFCTEKVEEKDKIRYMDLDEVKRQIDNLCCEKNVFLVLTGGEPTIRDDIVDIIRYAKSKGIDNIAMQTNGIRFADSSFTNRLIEAGLSFVSVTMTGHKAEVHDMQTKLKGSFDKTIEGLRNLVDNKIRVMVYVVITTYNYRNLDRLARLLVDSFPTLEQIQLTMPCISGGALTNIYEIVPQFTKSYGHVLKAMDIIINSKIDLTIDNLPLCFLDGYEKYSSEIKTYLREREGQLRTFQAERLSNRTHKITNYTNSRRSHKIKPDSCKACAYDYYCDGVWKGYADKFTMNELIPVINKRKEDMVFK